MKCEELQRQLNYSSNSELIDAVAFNTFNNPYKLTLHSTKIPVPDASWEKSTRNVQLVTNQASCLPPSSVPGPCPLPLGVGVSGGTCLRGLQQSPRSYI